MPRPIDPSSSYKVSIHAYSSYRYASTQPAFIDPDTGKRFYRRIHWGTVTEDLKFLPGKNYLLASLEERKKLIFPADWDLSELDKLPGHRKPGRPSIESQDENRLYGDVWLLEGIAQKTGLWEDLLEAFGGDQDKVDTVLTLAMYLLCGKDTYNQLAAWQRITKTPASRPLTSSYITRFTQGLTEQDRWNLLKLRAKRLHKNELLAVDSTSCSTYGSSLADIRYGKNKEHLPLPQTLEVIVYTLEGHMPVYYRSFPDNVPDSRSLSVILEDLRQANFKDVVLVTDRGYESIRNLETYIDLHQPMIMGTKLGQKHVRKILSQLGPFDHHPQEMQVDAKNRLYYLQKDLTYQIEGQMGNLKQADRLKLNLYFDPMRRGQELIDLDITLDTQKVVLEEYLENKTPLDDDETLKRVYRFYDLTYDHTTRILKAYTLNQRQVEKYRQEAGFFANTTHGLDLSPIEAHEHYKLRDEQEKYFALMKGICGQDRPRTSTESGRIGRSFILFVSQIMGCYLSHIRRTKLGTDFASIADVLGEMRPIRYIEHPHTKSMLTPFVGKQLEVCAAFDLDVPEG